MIVVRVQTVFRTAEKDWREGADCWGLEDQRKVAACAEKFYSLCQGGVGSTPD